jgi:hypothetical protein
MCDIEPRMKQTHIIYGSNILLKVEIKMLGIVVANLCVLAPDIIAWIIDELDVCFLVYLKFFMKIKNMSTMQGG